MTTTLFVSVFVLATCGLIYELVAGTLASYLLGDSVLQFSTVIGTYLFAMGVGSWASRFVGRGLVTRFIQVEAAVGLIGGFSAAILFAAFPFAAGFRILLYALVFVIGALVGIEIPLLMRILKDRMDFKDLVSQVLTLDYLGALGASLLFPLLFLPYLGILNTCFLFGLANVAVAAFAVRLFGEQLPSRAGLKALCSGVAVLLIAGLLASSRILAFAEGNLYADDVVLARTTPYQRVILTRWKDDLRLFLNGHLQFSSMDEYRYHEALVHPALSAHPAPERVLVLGGGDGMAAREILRDPRVGTVTLVDLDPEVTRLFRDHGELARLNGDSMRSPKLTVVNADAFRWLEQEGPAFDVAIVDLPDPSNHSLGKLYTTTFYARLRRRLRPGGLIAVQSTSPLFARNAYWCIERTVAAAGFKTAPYHAYVPSFGEWGFVIGATAPYKPPTRLPEGLRFLTPEILAGMFRFSTDMARVDAEPNRLNTQVLVQHYEREWAAVTR